MHGDRAKDLIALWYMDDAIGARHDWSQNGNHISPVATTNDTTTACGLYATHYPYRQLCTDFSAGAADTCLVLANAAQLGNWPLKTGSTIHGVTIVTNFYITTTSASDEYILFSTERYYMKLLTATKVLSCALYDNTPTAHVIPTNAAPATDAWHQVAIRHDGVSEISLWLDAAKQTVTHHVLLANLNDNENEFRIGDTADAAAFPGLVSETAIWARGLGDAELKEVYRVGLWRFLHPVPQRRR